MKWPMSISCFFPKVFAIIIISCTNPISLPQNTGADFTPFWSVACNVPCKMSQADKEGPVLQTSSGYTQCITTTNHMLNYLFLIFHFPSLVGKVFSACSSVLFFVSQVFVHKESVMEHSFHYAEFCISNLGECLLHMIYFYLLCFWLLCTQAVASTGRPQKSLNRSCD